MITQKRKTEIKKAALKTQKEAGIHSLPVNLNCIFDYYGWNYLTFNEAEEEGILNESIQDGYTDSMLVNGIYRYTVVFNDAFIPQRIRWTLAHEIGHIALEHACNKHDDELANEEAQYFAEQLLSPIAVLAKMGAKTKDDIMRLCNLSAEATGWRIPDLQRHFWYYRKYGYTNDDKAFLKQFNLL